MPAATPILKGGGVEMRTSAKVTMDLKWAQYRMALHAYTAINDPQLGVTLQCRSHPSFDKLIPYESTV